MHISLDSALGRQRRLNSVGESVFQIAPDAAAGYSLRSLTGGDPSVVRVRRESDNGERDFNASGVSSGELVNWVNQQITPPLDLRELTATGRDGPIIEAAAAYSLRNLSDSYAGDVVEVRRNTDGALKDFKASEVTDGTLEAWVNTSFANALPLDTASGAAAAYSLRNLSSSYTGSVVEVRRSSDGALRSFTAAEVTDGTLLAWVTAETLLYTSNFSTSNTDGWSSANCTIVSNIDKDSDGAGQPPSDNWLRISANDRISIRDNDPLMADIRPLGGGTYKIDVDYYAPVSVFGHRTIAFTSSGNTQSAAVNFSAGSGTKTYVLALTDAQVSGLTDLRIGSTQNYATGTLLYLKNIRVRKADTNGTVSKWYDQSGNNKHAVQGTPASQPKIVFGGYFYHTGIMPDGNLMPPALKFDGVNDYLTCPSLYSANLSVFTKATTDSTNSSNFMRLLHICDGSDSFQITRGGDVDVGDFLSKNTSFHSGTDAFNHGSISGNSLLTSITSGSATESYANGSLRSNVLDALGDGGNATTTIGARTDLLSSTFFNNAIAEIIIYDTDESDKRRAIEENIGSNYGITLTSPKDGTVSKWYDQSTTSGVPNAKHAVQTDAAKQPKIVSGGALVTGGLDFNNDFLVASSLSGLTGSLSMLSVSERDFSGNVVSLSSSSSGGRYFAIQEGGSSSTVNIRNPTTVNVSSNVSGSTRLTFALTTGATSTSVGANGSAVTTTSDDYGDGFSGTDINQIAIGLLRTVSPTGYFDGRIKEVIVYNTDQSDNRTALEANIGEVYGIAGIPAYDNTVNGFVETWYDQSGNGNNATQLTAGSQPKIVNAGVYLGEVDFDGVNDYLQTTNSDLCNVSELSVFSVLKPHIAQSQVVAFSCGSVVSGSTGYGGWRLNLNGYLNQAQFQTQTIGNASMTGVNDGVGGNDTLVSYVANFPDAATFTNGQAGSSTSNAKSPSNNNLFKRRFRIGCQFTYQVASFYTKPIKEIILYTSDQSANRPAIEANINNQYEIY